MTRRKYKSPPVTVTAQANSIILQTELFGRLRMGFAEKWNTLHHISNWQYKLWEAETNPHPQQIILIDCLCFPDKKKIVEMVRRGKIPPRRKANDNEGGE